VAIRFLWSLDHDSSVLWATVLGRPIQVNHTLRALQTGHHSIASLSQPKRSSASLDTRTRPQRRAAKSEIVQASDGRLGDKTPAIFAQDLKGVGVFRACAQTGRTATELGEMASKVEALRYSLRGPGKHQMAARSTRNAPAYWREKQRAIADWCESAGLLSVEERKRNPRRGPYWRGTSRFSRS
jgi:hypothetical protein